MKDLTPYTFEMIMSLVAIAGGVARYLSNYQKGAPFKLSMFFASIFASGFAGIMFGLVGVSMNLPDPILFMMAGSGGFFADQAMKFVLESVTKKIQ